MEKGILYNNDLQMELKDLKGNTLRTILHFGAWKETREMFFKGRECVEIDVKDFDNIAFNYCSPYAKEIDRIAKMFGE